ncbi:MAG TPA: FHA domain-containing protein, partial [Isosphaeraceae bacterium]
MTSTPAGNGWALEVVRGADAGRLYALNGGQIVLGNALGGAPGIDLSDQEGNSPRRMAARQAQLECSTTGVRLRDLDSPGGTFVNRQRVLSGQGRELQ